MQGTRSNGLLTAGLATSALVLAVFALQAAPDPELVARWWPATALTTIVLFLAPARLARLLAGLTALLFLTASLVSGHDVVFAIGFGIANAVEALLVLRWLTGFESDRPQLRSWTDFRRCLTGITVASCAAGAITAMTIGIEGGQDLWRPLLWIAITHLGAQAVALPLVMRQPRHKLRISAFEVTGHILLLTLVALACREADPSEPVAFLLLPLLMQQADYYR